MIIALLAVSIFILPLLMLALLLPGAERIAQRW